jgi:hypothetical protein
VTVANPHFSIPGELLKDALVSRFALDGCPHLTDLGSEWYNNRCGALRTRELFDVQTEAASGGAPAGYLNKN